MTAREYNGCQREGIRNVLKNCSPDNRTPFERVFDSFKDTKAIKAFADATGDKRLAEYLDKRG